VQIRGSIALAKWVSGDPHPPPAISWDVDSALNVLRRHKLLCRCALAFSQLRPTWASQELEDAVAVAAADVVASLGGRLAATQAIQEVLEQSDPEVGASLVTLKGPTLFALTGDPAMIRNSGDIDLLCADPALLTECMSSLGYARVDQYNRPHEYVSLGNGAFEVDVHDYIPVLRCDSPATLDDGPWPTPLVSTSGFGFYGLPFSLILEHSVRREVDGCRLRIANVTLAAFLAILHLFREYAHSPFLKPFATVRLGEVAEIDLLMRLPDFEIGLFQSLVLSHGADTALRFYSSIYSRLKSGSTASSPLAPEFPYELWQDGFVVADDRADAFDDLIARGAPVVLPKALAQHGVASLDALSRSGAGAWQHVSSFRHGHVSLHHGDRPVDASFRITSTQKSLQVDICFHGAPSAVESVLLNFGDRWLELARFNESGRLVVHRGADFLSDDESLRPSLGPTRGIQGDCAWRVGVDWSLLGYRGSLSVPDKLPVLLGFRMYEREEDAFFGMSSGVLFAAEIVGPGTKYEHRMTT
jgi:hypothetical protein